MSTEQHEALKLAKLLSTGKFFSASVYLERQHALIVQMAEALEKNDDYLTGPTAWSDEQWDALIETTHAAKTAAKDYLK